MGGDPYQSAGVFAGPFYVEKNNDGSTSWGVSSSKATSNPGPYVEAGVYSETTKEADGTYSKGTGAYTETGLNIGGGCGAYVSTGFCNDSRNK